MLYLLRGILFILNLRSYLNSATADIKNTRASLISTLSYQRQTKISLLSTITPTDLARQVWTTKPTRITILTESDQIQSFEGNDTEIKRRWSCRRHVLVLSRRSGVYRKVCLDTDSSLGWKRRNWGHSQIGSRVHCRRRGIAVGLVHDSNVDVRHTSQEEMDAA